MLRLEVGQFLLPIKFARLFHDYKGVVALVEAFPGSRLIKAFLLVSFPDDFSHAGENYRTLPTWNHER